MAHQELSETVGRKRLSAGLTQAALAKHADISRQPVAAIESGAYLPKVVSRFAREVAELCACDKMGLELACIGG